MAGVLFIGDEVAAAGFRLAGIDCVVPAAGQEAQALAAARSSARVVLISAQCAGRVAPAELDRARRAVSPMLLVLADVGGGPAPPDLAAAVRRQLGMQT